MGASAGVRCQVSPVRYQIYGGRASSRDGKWREFRDEGMGSDLARSGFGFFGRHARRLAHARFLRRRPLPRCGWDVERAGLLHGRPHRMTPPLRTYGRTKARTLKPRQAALVEALLPHLAVPAEGGIDVA